MSYLTQKQLQQLSKYKKEQESDRDSFISGHSNKGRRMKLRHVKNSNSYTEVQIFIVLNEMNNWARFSVKFVSSKGIKCRDICYLNFPKVIKEYEKWILIVKTWT